MIVECQSCETRFQLDDARIPLQGVRVRCSRCKEAFFLPHPSTAADASGPSSGSTQVLSDPAQSAEIAASQEPEVEEQDWEFNEDIPGMEEAMEEAISDVLPASTDAVGVGVEGEDDEDPFGETGSFDFGSSGRGRDAQDAPEAEPTGHSLSESDDRVGEANEIGESDLDSQGELPDEEVDRSAIAMDGEAEPSAGFDGDSQDADGDDNWDFFSSGEGSDGAADGLDWSAAEPAAAVAASSPSSFVDAPLDIAQGTERGVSHYLASGVGLGMHAVGWVVTLALVGLTAWTGFQATAGGAHASTVAQAAVGGLRAEALTATWVDTERLGTVLVIGGELRNPSPAEAVPGMRIEVVLLDESGAPLGRSAVVAGAPFPRGALRRASQAAVHAQRETAANFLAWTPISGGESVPFEALLMDVPYEAARFDVRGEPLGAPLVPTVPVPLEPAVPLPRDFLPVEPLNLPIFPQDAAIGNGPLVSGH